MSFWNNPLIWFLAGVGFAQLFRLPDIFIKDQLTAKEVRRIDRNKLKRGK